MAQKRKQRTSIRTAAGTVQQQYLDRIRALRADPLRILPECPDGEPKVLAKARSRLERIAAGKVGFLDRRDKGLVGAVANILEVADAESVPRLVDQKIAGQRRFFLQRGHVSRACSLGVQNHDEPQALLVAYREMAKLNGLHFFAGPGLWCTGDVPRPPAAWVDQVGKDLDLQATEDGWSCPHDGARIVLEFRDGPTLTACRRCGKKVGNLHARIAAAYAGPRQRQPLEFHVILPDGTRWDLPPELAAAYRAGVQGDEHVLATALGIWREGVDRSDAPRYVIADTVYADQEAFLDFLELDGWERDAVAVLTEAGHVGRRSSIEAILDKHTDRLDAALQALLPADTSPASFRRGHKGMSTRNLLRQAQSLGEREARTHSLPHPTDPGPVAAWVDAFVRAVRQDDRERAVSHVREALGHSKPAPFHLYAFLTAAGGHPAMEASFSADARDAARAFTDPAKAILEAADAEYLQRLDAYLRETGTGERAV